MMTTTSKDTGDVQDIANAPSGIPSGTSSTARVVVFLLFVVFWLVVGTVQFVRDDSRLGWGMFPYVLEVQVLRIEYVDDTGKKRREVHTKKPPYLPRPMRPRHKVAVSMYGKGAWDSHVHRLLTKFAGEAPPWAAAVEARLLTTRSEQEPVEETIRVPVPPAGAP